MNQIEISCPMLIDFKLLKKQKKALLRAIYSDSLLSAKDKESFEGILGIIDAIQDHAVEDMGLSEDVVF